MKTSGIDALVVIGGDGTLSAASEIAGAGIPLAGIPKTIDNDISGTDSSVGFDTAVSIVTEMIDRLHTTAESHHRIMVVEVMGRNAGWIAVMAGIAGGADMVLIPEIRFTMDEVCRELKARYMSGKKYSIVVVAEGIHHEDITPAKVPECDRDECGHEKFVGAGNLIGKGDRKTARYRDTGNGPWPCAAWWNTHCIRPDPRNPVRCCSSRAAGSGKYRFHGCPAGFPDWYSSLKEVASRIKPVSLHSATS